MKPFAFSSAVFFLCVVANPVRAQGTIEFSGKYPKTNPVNNQVLIKGKITLDNGWKIVGNSVRAEAWEDWSLVKNFVVKLNKDGKSWSETKLVLAPGVDYNILGAVRVTDGDS